MAKKRYVGFKFENVEQLEPEFDAKGIETIRRDGIPAQAQIVESALRLEIPSVDFLIS
jgi:DNA polymerase zeta